MSDNHNSTPQNYWINSSANELIKNFIKECTFDVTDKLEILLNRGEILCKLSDNITYENIYNSEINLFNLLYNTGYLTKSKIYLGSNEVLLKIPNPEIARIFVNEVDIWFKQQIESYDLCELVDAFWNGDSEKFTTIISDLLFDTISYYDYHENYYHDFLVGLFSALTYSVKSNLESGLGLSDILITDSKRRTKLGACIEVKRVKDSEESLNIAALNALNQISEQKYDFLFKKERLKVINWGIAFYKKSCVALCKEV